MRIAALFVLWLLFPTAAGATEIAANSGTLDLGSASTFDSQGSQKQPRLKKAPSPYRPYFVGASICFGLGTTFFALSPFALYWARNLFGWGPIMWMGQSAISAFVAGAIILGDGVRFTKRARKRGDPRLSNRLPPITIDVQASKSGLGLRVGVAF